MKNYTLLLLLSFCYIAFLPVHSLAAGINLSVAASMTDAFTEIIARFTDVYPEISLSPNYASSGALARQIEQGAPVDIFISANQSWTRYLEEKQLIAPGTVRIFAGNTLVFVSADSPDGLCMDDLEKLDRIAIGTPQSVPAGQYARQALENSKVYSRLKQANKLIMAKDVRQALWYADQGAVDGAFVYKTDALLMTRARVIFAVPAALYDRVFYTIGLTAAGSNREEALAFYSFVESPEAIAILARYGFSPADRKTPERMEAAHDRYNVSSLP